MKSDIVKSVLILFAFASVFSGAPASGNVEFGGYADFIFYNYENETSSFIGNHLAFDLLAEPSEDVFVKAELEWSTQRLFPEGGRIAATRISYAYIDYPLAEEMRIITGKFLLPFNVYNERLYRPDTARFANPPFINSLLIVNGISPLPVKAAGTGVQLRGVVDAGTDITLGWAAYIASRSEQEGGDGAGGRIAVISGDAFELGISGYTTGIHGADSDLVMFGSDIFGSYEPFELRSEYIRAKLDDSVDGFYLQAAYFFLEDYEVAVRYEKLDSIKRTSIGAGWEMMDNLMIRLSYEWSDLADGITGQLAISF